MAVFQVSYRTRCKHPKKEMDERYSQLGVKRLRTAELEALRLAFYDGVQ